MSNITGAIYVPDHPEIQLCWNKHCLEFGKHEDVNHDTCQACSAVLNPPNIVRCDKCIVEYYKRQEEDDE